jgi:hypothetical protein
MNRPIRNAVLTNAERLMREVEKMEKDALS